MAASHGFKSGRVGTLRSLVIFSLFLVGSCQDLEEGDPCDVGKNKGKCLPGSQCTTLAEAVRLKIITRRNIPKCGLGVYEELICCPILDRDGPSTPVTRPSTFEPHFQSDRPAAKACDYFRKNYPLPLTSHILGGIPAEEGEFPYMAAIGYPTIGGNTIDWRCGGSLIDPRFVLTAAHCVYDPNAQPTVVRLGTINLKTPKDHQDIEVQMVHLHPNYSSLANYDDIAILELKKPAQLNNFVQPVCLTEDVKQIPPETPVYVTGFGTVSLRTGNRSDVLLKADLELEDQMNCSRSFRQSQDESVKFRLSLGILESQICAIDRHFKKDSCRGDSGGPLSYLLDENLNLYSLVGVISTGFICGSATPGIYTRVPYYLQYIEDIVWKKS